MLDEGHRRAARGTDVVVGFVETHGRPRTAEKLEGLELIPRKDDAATAARGSPRWTSRPCSPAHPQVALVDELAHTNVPGHRPHEKRWQDIETAARGRHRRHQHRQHPAPGIAQRRRRGDHRRAAARDRAGLGGARGRAGRARRHDARGAAPADGPRQHLQARQGRRGAVELLPARQPHRAARARPALAGRQRRGGAAALPRAARHRPAPGRPGSGSSSR